MSVTATTMITRAMRLIRCLGTDQSPTANEATDGLNVLTSMLDAWGIERLMIYQIQQTTHSWTANASSKTIGTGGDFSVARPIKIEPKGCFFRDSSNQDYPLGVYPRQEYDSIVVKTSGGSIPEFLFYDDGFPTRTLYAYPVPDSALTLYLNHWLPLQTFNTLTEAISLPPGYQAAIEYNLALWLAPEFGAAAVAAAKDIQKQADMLKTIIKSINRPSMASRIDYIAYGGPSRIESDG